VDETASSAGLAGLDPIFYGVNLAFVQDFVRTFHVPDHVASAVVRNLVASLDFSAHGKSVAEHVAGSTASDGSPAVAAATLFVSHAHACSFNGVMQAIRSHLSLHGIDPKSAYLWIDLFSLSQQDLHAGLARVPEVIHSTRQVALVLDPMDAPVALSREWCLFEVAIGLKQGCTLTICAPDVERARIITTLGDTSGPGRDAVHSVVQAIDIRDASATYTGDSEFIHATIDSFFGDRGEGEGAGERAQASDASAGDTPHPPAAQATPGGLQASPSAAPVPGMGIERFNSLLRLELGRAITALSWAILADAPPSAQSG